MKNMKNDKDSIVGIAPALAGIFIPIVLFVLIFAEEQAWILVPIAASFALLGIGVAYFASKKKYNKKSLLGSANVTNIVN